MRCLDATFLVDVLKGLPAARRKAEVFKESGERLSVAAPALAEILIGAYYRGGSLLRETLELASALDVVDVDVHDAAEAARLGADLLRRGEAIATTDLLIAAAAKLHGQILVTRDRSFSRIPGLAVEAY